MKKNDEIRDPNSCLNRAQTDEPVFVLRAHDASAADLVREWAQRRHREIVAGRKPTEDIKACSEAHGLADEMERWRERETQQTGMPDRSPA